MARRTKSRNKAAVEGGLDQERITLQWNKSAIRSSSFVGVLDVKSSVWLLFALYSNGEYLPSRLGVGLTLGGQHDLHGVVALPLGRARRAARSALGYVM